MPASNLQTRASDKRLAEAPDYTAKASCAFRGKSDGGRRVPTVRTDRKTRRQAIGRLKRGVPSESLVSTDALGNSRGA